MENSYSSDARATRVLRRQTATVLGTLPHLADRGTLSPWLISPARSRFSPWLVACKTGK
jgi:hypothetical protein